MMRSRLVALVLAAAVLAVAAAGAMAFWSPGGSGHGSAAAGTLAAPAAPEAVVTGETVELDWTTVQVPAGAVAYHVQRSPDGAGSWDDACGSSHAAPIAAPPCEDTPDDGTYVYRVSARFASWSTAGSAGTPVDVVTDPAPSVSVARATGQAAVTRNLPIRFDVTFSEAVTGFVGSDLVRAGSATGGRVTLTGSGASYGVVVSDPDGNLSDGTVTISVGAGAAVDTGGKSSAASPAPAAVTHDTTAPAVAVNLSRAADQNGWYNRAVTASADAQDALSEVDCQPPVVYSGPDAATASLTRSCTDGAGNTASGSTTFKYDATEPAINLSSLAPSSGTETAGLLGSTLYFQSCTTGGFRLSSAVTDAMSGAGSANYPSVSAGRWTHANETVSTPAGGPFASGDFLIAPNNCTGGRAATPPGYTVTGRDAAGNAATSSIAFVADDADPAVTSVTLANHGTLGTVNAGDSVTLTYAEDMDAKSFCANWSNGSSQSLSATATLAPNEQLAITAGSCTVRYGRVTPTGNYNTHASQAMTFSTSTLAWDPQTKRLTLVLGTRTGGTVGTGVAAGSAAYAVNATATLREWDIAHNVISAGASTANQRF